MKDEPAPISMPQPQSASVTVLMAVRDGARYLPAQLQSIYAQTLRPTQLVVSDDGSVDGSVEIILAETNEWVGCEVTILRGPGISSAENFSSLLRNIPADASYIAFSDQDDAWLPSKLEDAVADLQRFPESEPALFGSATWICDGELNRMHKSRSMRGVPKFQHALAQNFAGGNTMVLNPAATALVRRVHPKVPNEVIHDWWVYLLVSGAGGHMIYSDKPSVLYRQHGGNVIGANNGIRAAATRGKRMVLGDYRRWNSANLRGLEAAKKELTPENRDLVRDIVSARAKRLPGRLQEFRRLGICRYGVLGRIGLWASVLLNRF